jgi:hypothetical protein
MRNYFKVEGDFGEEVDWTCIVDWLNKADQLVEPALQFAHLRYEGCDYGAEKPWVAR